MTLKEKFIEFDKLAPLQTAHLQNGDFSYRYYKNESPALDVTLVFLAGGSGLGNSIFYLADMLLSKYNLITFNYPMDFPTNESLADAMAELFIQIGAKNIYLVGQSYGGLLAQIMARRHPDLIKGLILSGTCSLSGDINFEGMKNIVEMIHPKKVEKNIKKDKRIPIFLMVPAFKFMCKKVVKDKEMRKTFSDVVDICKNDLTNDYFVHMDMLLGDLSTEFGSHKPEDFQKFDNEVLIFFSEGDTIFCDNLKKALIRLMTNPVVCNLEGGHLALLEHLDDYVSALDRFLLERNPRPRH